ncbi:ferritin-like domain-containing protein [Geoalkalibacter sp.]|uniref:ferritin-like domain-containing protein n=1 Tax=Geoalkalibacter sp. TaxID=3041440 RepID=UPI00272E1730|nr:ferritin-like domain-containing protein [Geoalkalibacter sp.]
MTPGFNEFIALLNRDLRLEYMAVIQYTQHFGMLNPRAVTLGEHLQNLAGDELAHALILAEQIRLLGGRPDVHSPRARTSEKPLALLAQDRKGEQDAIVRYQSRIVQAEALGLDSLAQILRHILAIEERHLELLDNLIGNVSRD